MSASLSSPPSLNSRPTIGVDIGGTKCAVSRLEGDRVIEVLRIPTGAFAPTFEALAAAIAPLVGNDGANFGISCGGPLDAARGVIVGPPNLAVDWHGVAICELLTQRFGGQAVLMNDANACALAEWHFGAGRGSQHMIFLTSGTGMGSGLILNGRLYEGATGDAGEIGHVRLRADGPIGFGKAGSVEGFTSGGGIARLAISKLKEKKFTLPTWAADGEKQITTKRITEAALTGEPLALEIMHEAGTRLGETLAILIDLFNPEKIVIGGFYPHCEKLFAPALNAALAREALEVPAHYCAIAPAQLGETIGSHGAIAAALHAFAR
ncbi:ROK family protein [Oleiharenicola lentus]|uniref:ROK family protein n=1 Tax=Oleiharenicola lentus TaxID=2508720 RepID=UPI003F671BBA